MDKEVEKEIGNTPLLDLTKLINEGGRYATNVRLLAKLEKNNPGGSVKDRVAKAILDDAERMGKLSAGGTVVEATSGNTGIGLALLCASRGYKSVIVMPNTMSLERRTLIQSYGAEIVLTDGAKGMQGAVEKAQEIVKNTPNAILADQFNNAAGVQAHYEGTGPEIWAQTKGQADTFIACVGSGGTLTGVGRFLKEKNPLLRVVAVEPASSPLLSQGKAGAHGIQGIGANFVPSILDCTVYDEVVTVTDEEAFAMARKLYKEEYCFVGISSGAAVVAALKIAQRHENAGKTIVTILPDGGERYLSTKLFE